MRTVLLASYGMDGYENLYLERISEIQRRDNYQRGTKIFEMSRIYFQRVRSHRDTTFVIDGGPWRDHDTTIFRGEWRFKL